MIIRRITAVLVCKNDSGLLEEFACTRDPIKATTGKSAFVHKTCVFLSRFNVYTSCCSRTAPFADKHLLFR